MLKNTFLKLKNSDKLWRKACDSQAFKEMKKAKFYCYFIKEENGKFLSTFLPHSRPIMHTRTHTHACMYARLPLSLNESLLVSELMER